MASERFRSSPTAASPTAAVSLLGVEEGELLCDPFARRCLFAAGSDSMLGEGNGDAAARCMNFMVASRDDIVFGCLFDCAMVAKGAVQRGSLYE